MNALVGDTFGRLTVMSVFTVASDKFWRATVRCECGNERSVFLNNVRFGKTKSCGCLRDEHGRAQLLTHGQSRSMEHRAWRAAKGRCFNKNNHAYARYGGRGITMSASWRSDFTNFLSDMGLRPHGTSLDRINNEGNYERGNCRWATPKEQANNRRSSRRDA